MNEHPIENLMMTAMNSIEKMIEVNTIVGEPMNVGNGVTIIPVSKVCFGFGAGGTEFNKETLGQYDKNNETENIQYKLPFGGGSGAGASILPIAFLVIEKENVKLISVNHANTIDKILDYIPDMMNKVEKIVDKVSDNKNNDEDISNDKKNDKDENTSKDNNDDMNQEKKKIKIKFEEE